MSFNPDVSKQAQEVIFSRKEDIIKHPVVFFSNLPMNRKSTQKHLGLFPVDTGWKMNVHKTFRSRPGRLLNVLCTFSLCPVSIGLLDEKLNFSEHMRTEQKLKTFQNRNFKR